MKVNHYYDQVQESYLFSDVNKRVAAYQSAHPENKIIRMGIGDVTRPLSASVCEEIANAGKEMGSAETFHGYAPYQGYDFLQNAIIKYYSDRKIELQDSEVFVSDGVKSDLGNILDLFDRENTVLIPDPVYPVYVDTNIMAGRSISFVDATEQNGFLPMPDPSKKADIIYICSPNNPTGAVYSHEQLRVWVEYALDCGAVILFDAAYESFVQDPSLPHSIYEVEDAKKCAIEFCSLSKMAGFTGTRCGWTIVPQGLVLDGGDLNAMWLRRQSTKFNGVSYVIQRAAAAVFSPDGMAESKANVSYYLENAKVIAQTYRKLGVPFTGGENSPYIWHKCPNGMKSWEYFDYLLEKANVVGTPGAGFGKNGEGYFRLTSFGTREATVEAMERIEKLF